MKTLRVLMAVIFLSAMFVFSHPGFSYADEEEHSKGDIQMLRDSAAALKATNPDLSDRLSKYANREENEAKEGAQESEEAEEHENK